VYGRTEAIELLLAGGADPNQTDPHGNGALWTAVLSAPKEVRVEIITRLLRAGADADHKNRYGRSPRDAASTIGYGVELPFADVPNKHAGTGAARTPASNVGPGR
jgi:ankyrin repeat protein